MSKTIFILSHTNGQPGGLDTLEEYVAFKGYREIRLLHPLDDYSEVDTTFLKPGGTIETIGRRPKGIFNLVGDFYLSVKYIQHSKFDIFIGASNFDTIPAIFCRKLLGKKIEKIVYYPRDFSKDRFSNPLLNKIYLKIESVASKHSDLIASNTKRAESQRIQLGLNTKKSVIIPNPVNLQDITFARKKINKSHFIYVGDVSIEHGLYDLIQTIHPLIKKLVIIGSGNDWERVTEFTKSQKFVTEIHHAKTRKFVMQYLQSYNGIGLAPYNNESKWTYYCSPLKVGEYISCGLPVLMSSVPEIASLVTKMSYGLVYKELKIDPIKKALKKLDTNEFYKKSEVFYKDYSAQNLLKKLGI